MDWRIQLFINSIEGALSLAEIHGDPQVIEETGLTLLQLIR
ncbi:hypothetical protein [Chengkuizengella axinellae]|uniref:Uncharacterized protein n=1 Tax=Chengkuizengella axinellae TaxID=3064388 RepID=A0ABT9J5V0_9BACL|nr:hypothetical protein [Chengkuizengella sp. 2205SS18-9]MDP5277001.1 hypothetical protein [Chengkuizengella sp. 2205SS18-9]